MSADPARPFRHLCPEADLRDAMSDEEFWDHVYPQQEPFDPDPDFVPLSIEPCPVCGESGPCGYDPEGRPMIHTDTELPEDEVPS